MGDQYDNDFARALDAEAADAMENAGCDIKFIGRNSMRPAFRNRANGVWSCCVWRGGQPMGTLLARDLDEMRERLETFETVMEIEDPIERLDALDAWRRVYEQQRYEVIAEFDLHTNDRADLAAQFET